MRIALSRKEEALALRLLDGKKLCDRF